MSRERHAPGSSSRRSSTVLLALGAFAGAVLVLVARRANRRRLTDPSVASVQERMARLDDQFRVVQRIGRVGTWEVDLATRRAWWSDEVYRILGVEPGSLDVTMDRFLAFVHPDDVGRVRAAGAAALQTTEPVAFEFRVVRPAGAVRYIERRAAVVRGERGTADRVIGTVRDITERRLQEIRTAEMEARYRLLFEKSPLPLWVFDEETLRFLAVNDAAVRHYGFSTDEFMAMTLHDIRPADDVPRFLEDHAVAGAGLRHAGLWKHRRKDGSIIDVEIVRHQFVLAGRPVQLVLAIDVTDRLRAELDLRNSRAEAQTFSQRLQSAIEEERARIAREIHDELGQMLTGLRMRSALLETKLADAPADVHRALAEMDAVIDEGVVAVRRIATELRPGVLDSFGIVAAIEWLVHDIGEKTDLRTQFENRLTADPALVDERATHVFRIVQEALTNIVRHARARSVSVSLAGAPGQLTIRVVDDGRGFEIRTLNVQRTLGVPGMRERVRLLEGSIDIDSAAGAGTRVTLRVPTDAARTPQ